MVIKGPSLIVGDISPCWISVINAAQRESEISKSKLLLIFQGQRMHKLTALDNCC